MPALLPPPMPRFSCWITRASGNRSRTSSSVPSVEPWSTTIVSWPRTDSRQRSTQGSESYVTTTTETSSAIGDGRGRPAPHSLPEDHREARKRERERHQEEQESRCERRVRADAELAEEADEERLAHAEAVDRERHEHDEEKQRAEHDVRPHRQMDAHGDGGRPDRDDARELRDDGGGADDEERPRVVAVAVDPLVDGADRPFDARALQVRNGEAQHAPHAAREEDDARDRRQYDEESLDPEVGAYVVAADREHEADRCEDERDRAAERTLEQNRTGGGRAVAGVTACRLVDPGGVAADAGREHLADRVGHEVRTREPRDGLVDAARAQQQLPAPALDRNGDEREPEREQQPPRAGVTDDARRLADVDLRDDVRGGKARHG